MKVKGVLAKIKVFMNKRKHQVQPILREVRQFCFWLKAFIGSKLDYFRVDKKL